jgi:hypothetical protein
MTSREAHETILSLDQMDRMEPAIGGTALASAA